MSLLSKRNREEVQDSRYQDQKRFRSAWGDFEDLPSEMILKMLESDPQTLVNLYPVSTGFQEMIDDNAPRILLLHTSVPWKKGPGGWLISDGPMPNGTVLWIHLKRRLYALNIDPSVERKTAEVFRTNEVSWDYIWARCTRKDYCKEKLPKKPITKIQFLGNNSYLWEEYYQADIYFTLEELLKDLNSTTRKLFTYTPSLWEYLQGESFKICTAVNVEHLIQGKKINYLPPDDFEYRHAVSRSLAFTAISMPYPTQRKTHEVWIANFDLDLKAMGPLRVDFINHLIRLTLNQDGTITRDEFDWLTIHNKLAEARYYVMGFTSLPFYYGKKQLNVFLPSNLVD